MKIPITYSRGDTSPITVRFVHKNKDLEAIFNIVNDPECLEALRDFLEHTRKSGLRLLNVN